MAQLGSGQFGEVCKAQWTVGGHTLELAVKTLKSGASEVDKVKFLQEAAIMGQFNHSHVIKMYGVVTLGKPVSEPFLIRVVNLKGSDMNCYFSFSYLIRKTCKHLFKVKGLLMLHVLSLSFVCTSRLCSLSIVHLTF